MYRIFFDDLPLYDPRSRKYQLREPDVHLAVDEAGEMSFTIDPSHPHANQLTRMKGVVRLTAGSVQLFRGRVRKDTRDFNLVRRIEVEGLLACLNDSVIPPHAFPDDFLEDEAYQTAAESGNVVEFYLGWLLDQHNAQVGPDQQVQLGDVTVTDPNNYISRSSSEYLPTMEVVRKKLKDLLGGYLLADYSTDDTILHYYDDLPLTNVQEVEFAKNLLDLEVELDAAETYTAILPVGKDGLTISALEDGEVSPGYMKAGLIVYSVAAEEAAGGRITRKVDWKDVTEATNLRTKAAALLATEGVKHIQTISCKAVDLGGVDNIPRFMVGRYVQLKSPPHGFAAAYPLMELEPNILDPGDTEITLGATVKAASDIAHDSQRENEEKIEQTKGELIAQILSTVTTTLLENTTEVLQDSERIMLAALENYVRTSDLENYKETVRTEFDLIPGKISAKFEETKGLIDDVNGDLQQVQEKLTKHFDFTLEDGLVIRAGVNTMSLRLDNGLISFLKNGEQFGWWDGVDFHTGNIVIDVTERAQFGNFAAIPRSTGNLSWMKVRG